MPYNWMKSPKFGQHFPKVRMGSEFRGSRP